MQKDIVYAIGTVDGHVWKWGGLCESSPQTCMYLVCVLVGNCGNTLYLCVLQFLLNLFIQQIFAECSQVRTLQEMRIMDQYPS